MLENLGQVLPSAARKYGDKTGLIIDGREFSFNQLCAMSGRVANGLRGLGVVPGDRVTLCSQNRWEWIVSYYAIARVGAVINPINVMLTAEEVSFVVKGLRRQSADLIPGQRQCTARDQGSLAPAGSYFFWRRSSLGGSVVRRAAEGQSAGVRRRRDRGRSAVDDRIHVRHDRSTQGRYADSPGRSAQFEHDGERSRSDLE